MDEHSHPASTHRNSLVGSTKQKPLSPQIVTAEDSSTVTIRGDMVSALLKTSKGISMSWIRITMFTHICYYEYCLI
jgi:hypothetical protein